MIRVAWLVIAVALLPQDKGKEAQAAFLKVAEGFEKAKTARVKFSVEFVQGKEKIFFKGTVTLKEGNKARIEADGPEKGGGLLVCDGKKLRARIGDELRDAVDAGESVRADVASVQARLSSTLLATEVLRDLARGRAVFGKEQKLELSGFAFGDKDGDNVVITYKATMAEMPPMSIQVWIDAKGCMVKRSGEVKEGEHVMFSFAETFSEWAIAGEIGDDAFKLPEKQAAPPFRRDALQGMSKGARASSQCCSLIPPCLGRLT